MCALLRAMAAAVAATIVLLAGCGRLELRPVAVPDPAGPCRAPATRQYAGVPVPEPSDVRRNRGFGAALRRARRSGGIRALDRRAARRGAVAAAPVRASCLAESDSCRIQNRRAESAAARHLVPQRRCTATISCASAWPGRCRRSWSCRRSSSLQLPARPRRLLRHAGARCAG